MAWHPVALVGEVPEGEAIQVHVQNQPIAVYRVGGNFFATHDTCTHAQASLSEGYIDGDCVECPLHEGVFHIPTGKPVSGPVCEGLKTFETRIDGDQLLVNA